MLPKKAIMFLFPFFFFFFLCLNYCLFSNSAVSCSLQSPRLEPARLLCLRDFPGENTGVGCILKLEISERQSGVVQQSNLDEPAFSRKTARLNF